MLRVKEKFQQYLQYFKGNILVERFAKVFSVDVFVRGINFLLIPLFLHLMTKEEVGVYDYLYTFAFTLAPTFSLGLHVGLVKMYHSYDNSRDRGQLLFSINITLISFLSAVFGIVYGFGLDFYIFDFLIEQPIDYQSYRFFILLAIIVFIYNVLLTMFFVTSEKISKIQRYNIGRCLLVNIIVFASLLFLSGDKVKIRLIATYVSEFVVLVYFFRYFYREMTFVYNKEMIKRCLKISLPIMMTSVSYVFINFADKYFVQKYCGIEDFADYNKAVQFALILPVIFNSFQNIWMPLMMKETDVKVLKRRTNRVAKIVLLSFVAISLILLLAIFVALLLGIIPQNYYNILKFFPLVAVAQILSVLSLLYQYYTSYFEKTYFNLIISIIVGTIGVILNYFAVKQVGVFGVAVVMILINLTMWLLYYWFSNYNINKQLQINK